MRTLVLTGLLLASVATGFLMGTSHSASYAATSVQYMIFNLGPITGCPVWGNKQYTSTNCQVAVAGLSEWGAQGWRLVTVVDGNAIFMK